MKSIIIDYISNNLPGKLQNLILPYQNFVMTLHENIINLRKAKKLTQQELADLAKVDLRTIQRIESGKSQPRAYTLRTIEEVLGFQADTLPETTIGSAPEDSRHFLRMFCLSCFSYLAIPYVHFLIPNYLLNRSKENNPAIRQFAQKVLYGQIWWVVATTLIFLAVLLINFIINRYGPNGSYISYLIPFFGMYGLNLVLISINIHKARRLAVQLS